MADLRMRSSADPRAPGIYQTHDEIAPPPLSIANARVAGFVGITQKGPMNEPVRVGNWDEFVEYFGFLPGSYTADSVYGFFQNGGTDCWIVRVAHCAPKGEVPGMEHASFAEHVQVDDWQKPSLQITALNEGTWGNAIWVRCLHAPGAQALLTRDIEIGAGEAYVNQVRGFEVGALVKIHSRDSVDYVVLTHVGDKIVRWAAETPINHKHSAAAPTYLEVMTFEIHVALRDRREVFKGLQMSPLSRNYAPRIVAQRSRLIRAIDIGTTSPVPHNLPEPLAMTRLSGGRDGLAAITPEDFVGIDLGPTESAGVLALARNEQVGLLVAPDAMLFYERDPGPMGELKTQHIQDTMIAVCENQKDRFAILDIPQSKDIEWVRRWRRRTESSYCAYYWPWLVAVGPDEAPRVVPPSAFMAGCYGRQDREEGVHHVAANLELKDVIDVSLRLSEEHIGVLNDDSINTFRIQRGVRPWGARTASSEPQWRYIPTRRLFIMLRRSLDAGFAWVCFEPNTPYTWDVVRRRTVAFLTDLHSRGMLAGGNPSESFFVKCDAETNPPDQIDEGVLLCQIGVAPTTPTEFIMISLVQTMQAE